MQIAEPARLVTDPVLVQERSADGLAPADRGGCCTGAGCLTDSKVDEFLGSKTHSIAIYYDIWCLLAV